MRASLIMLMLALAALPSAWADDKQALATAQVSQEPPRIDLSDVRSANEETAVADRSNNADAALAGPSVERQETTRQNSKSYGGFHWMADGDHPALAYRFSESGMLRLRGSARGARVVLGWNY